MGERRGFVTLLTNDSFAPGAVALGKSLRKWHPECGDALPMILLATPAVGRATRIVVRREGWDVVEVDPLPNPYASHVPSWAECGMSKLHVWRLGDRLDRAVFLDADCLVVGRLDALLETDLGAAGLAAAPDVMPPDRFNAGVLVVRPSLDMFERLLEALRKVEGGEPDALPSYDGGDTGFLNAVFADWHRMPAGNRLGFGFNAQRIVHAMTKANPNYWTSIRPLAVVHYSSSPKPWAPGASKGALELEWWSAYTGMI